MNLPDATTRAWMAGIVDGEGCITLSKQIRKGRPSPAYRESVTVSNTDYRIVQPFYLQYGGTIYHRADDRIEFNWSDSYTWHCPVSVVPWFLKSILQFLIGKRKQAEVLLEFIRLKNEYPRQSLGQGKGSAPLGEEELEFREKVWNHLRELNSKGRYSRYMKMKGGDAICNSQQAS